MIRLGLIASWLLAWAAPFSVHAQIVPPASQPATQAVVTNFKVLSAGLTAPATVHVHALDLPLDAGTCLTARYEWDFGDAGAAYNRLVGWNAAHTFDRPGRYTIALKLTSQFGVSQQFRREVIVAPRPAAAVYVSSRGNDAGDGHTPASAVRTIHRAAQLAGDGEQILLRRGERFDLPIPVRVAHRALVIGAYGRSISEITGLPAPLFPVDNPVVRYTGEREPVAMFEFLPRSSDVVIQDVTFDTIFTRDAEKKNMPAAVSPRGTNATIRRCVFLNVGDGVNTNARPAGVLMQDCVAPLVTGLRSYLAWIEGSDQVYLGNHAVNSTREAVMRISFTGAERVLISCNSLTNLDRTAVDRIDTAKNALTVHFGRHVYVADNILSTGPVMIGPLGEGDGVKQKAWRLRDVVFECNRLVKSPLRVNHGMDGLVIRNNRMWADDRTAINVQGYDKDYNRTSRNVTIVHNTASNAGSRGNFLRVGGGVVGLNLVNNLYVAPKLAPGSHSTAVVYVAQDNLSGWSGVGGNVWPITKPDDFASGGVFYVWPSWSDARGYRSLDRWNAVAQANDVQSDIEVDQNLRPTNAGLDALRRPRAPGVGGDALGSPRDAGGTCAGAMETRR